MTEKGSKLYQPLTASTSGNVSIVSDSVTASTAPSIHHPKSDEKLLWLMPTTALLDANQKNGVESEATKLIATTTQISHAQNQSEVLKSGIDYTMNNTKGEFGCSLCSFAADNAFALTQHSKMHLNKSDKTIRTAASVAPSVAPVGDVVDDETSSTSAKVTLFKASGEQVKDTNVKQIEKIQELRNRTDASKKHSQSSGSVVPNSKDGNEEKCPHCPFSTVESETLKEHMMRHICVSGHIDLANCDYCDYSIADESMLVEHNNIHFDLIKNKQKTVAFYTIYDDLELTTIDQQANNNDERHPNQYAAVKKLYPKIDSVDFHYSSDKENKILVDINTGQIVMNNY